jgi:hypothetical protein
MSFLAPAAFLFALSLPVVIVFYLLKRKRTVRLVASTLLWQRFLAETQANAPFQKLRRNWLLLLQLLLLLLVVLALSRPFFQGTASPTRLRVLILDGSASMQATDEKPSRFAQARTEALKWVDGLRDGEQMMILLAAASTEVKQSPTTDKAALRRALQACEPADTPTKLADALKTAGAFTFEKRGEETVTTGEIHLFSDGAAPDLDEFANKNLPVVYHRMGSGANNVAIVRLDVRGNPENPAERAIFANVANYGSNAVTADLDLLLDGNVLSSRTVSLGPTNSELLIFSAPQQTNGVFTVRLNTSDDLAADNQASVVSLLPTPARILLVSRGNRFLDKALGATTTAPLTTAAQLTDRAENYDLVVLDDVLPTVWPKPNILTFHVAATNLFPNWRNESAPVIVDWRNTHPLLRFVNFDNVQLAESLGVTSPPWGVPLVDSPKTPLILAGEVNRQRVVWVGFDPLQSTWPLRVSFPIFIANAVDWLSPAGGSAERLMVQPGTAFRWPLTEPVSSATVQGPDGRTRTLSIEPGSRELLVPDTAKQGVYRVVAGTNRIVFAANLADSNESNIRPREEIAVGKYASIAASTVRRSNAEAWRWLALAGLAVLMFEWWFYHKRSV